MLNTMLTVMGIEPEKLETLQTMDTAAMFNSMDYTIMGLLPIFIFIVIVGNSLIVDQVDKGSLAYVLSTPTKRSAVANTQRILYRNVYPGRSNYRYLLSGKLCFCELLNADYALRDVKPQRLKRLLGLFAPEFSCPQTKRKA